MEFRAVSKFDIEEVRKWRNSTEGVLRTPFLLTKEMQEKFYEDVICDRNSKSRFWSIWIDEKTGLSKINNFIGMIGLENIEWENGIAEISIILNPEIQGKGYGKQAVHMLLDKGFNELRLENIYGEVYASNKAFGFWQDIIKKYNGFQTILPKRKYFKGNYYPSLYFSIEKEAFNESNNP